MVLPLDAESGTDELSIGNLLSRMNYLSPACRLPVELLDTIFVLCTRESYSSLALKVPCWVNVSYVCSRWRQVALDCPVLWAHHFVVSRRWTEELLARSKQAPLKVQLPSVDLESDSWWLNLVEQLMHHAGRFEEFSLLISIPSNYHNLDILSSSAPLLRNLKIRAVPFEQPEAFDSFLPFNGDTPTLRELTVSECPVPWYSFKLGSLTTLDLFDLPDELQQDIMEFLATLRGMRQLSRLYLNEALASAAGFISSEAFRTFQKIELPSLADFLISSHLSTVIALLTCVNIPSNALLRLGCFAEEDSTFDDCTLLSAVLAQRFNISEVHPSSSLTIESLVISLGSYMFLSTSLQDDFDFDPRADDRGFNISLTLIVDWSRSMISGDHDIRIVCDICGSIPLANLQVIHVDDPLPSPLFWKQLLQHCSRLRRIKLSNGAMPDLASLLSVSHLTAHDDLENGDNALVPDLEVLEFSSMEFGEEGDSDPSRPIVTLRSLFGTLATRRVPHGRLIMTKCMIGKSGPVEMACSWGNGDICIESLGGATDVRLFGEARFGARNSFG